MTTELHSGGIMTRRRNIIAFLLLALGAAGMMMLWKSPAHKEVRYRTVKASLGSITNSISASGKLAPGRVTSVGTQASGLVKEVHAEVNQFVKKGDLLTEIDPLLMQSALKQSEANLEIARVNYEQAQRDLRRIKILLDKQYIAKINLEQAEVGYLSAKNNYESMKSVVERDRVNLNYTKVYAPIDGVIVTRSVEVGQTINASQMVPILFTIASELETMKITMTLSEAEISKIKEGMPVTFNVDTYPGKEFNGRVDMVNLYPLPGQTVSAVLVADNKNKMLYPGMTAFIRIITFEKKDVLRVPVVAMRFTPPVKGNVGVTGLLKQTVEESLPYQPLSKDKKAVYVLRDGTPQLVEFTYGVNDDVNIEVTGNEIKEGEEIIVGIDAQKAD
jgi:HlyD family secretion protein